MAINKGIVNNTPKCVINTSFTIFLSLKCVYERKREKNKKRCVNNTLGCVINNSLYVYIEKISKMLEGDN